MDIRPPTTQSKNLLKEIRLCLEKGHYNFSKHALKRMSERKADLQDVIHVLKNGHYDQTKDTWDNKYQTWNYSIVGTSVDQKKLRIVVNIDESFMIVVTVIR